MDPPTHTYAAMSGTLAHRPHTTRKSKGCSVCHTSRSESYPVEGRFRYIYPLRKVVLKRYPHTDIETSNPTIAIRPSARFRTCLRTSILRYLLTLTPSHYTVVSPLARFARSWPNPNPNGHRARALYSRSRLPHGRPYSPCLAASIVSYSSWIVALTLAC